MKLKKLFIFGFLPTTLLASSLSIVSCEKNEKYVKSDIGGLNNYFNPENVDNKNQKLINDAIAIKNGNDENAKKLLNQKTILITTNGKVNDRSFNQSSWESISKFSDEIGNESNSYFETNAISQSEQNDAYNYAIKKDYKIWIMTGFQQENLFRNWLNIGKNRENFNKKGIKIISVDWFSNDLVEPGRLLGLNFRTQEAAFVASYSASKLLKEINEENSSKFANPYLTSFAGGDFSGATNFNYGFYEGLRQFNEDNNYKVNANRVVLNTGFSFTQDARHNIKNIIDGDGNRSQEPQVILPVAGSLTGALIDLIKDKKSDQWVIGVDTDQSLAFPNDKKILLTSIEKRISIAVYKALISFYGLNDGENDTTNIFSGTNYKINPENGFIVDSNGKEVNVNINGGYLAGFVGTSQSTLDSNLKFKNNKTYAQRYDEITKETWDEFYGEDKKSGRLNKSVSEEKGLKPDQKVIDDFEKAITSEKQDSEKILALKNVLFGFMTFNNLESYFNPVINQINQKK